MTQKLLKVGLSAAVTIPKKSLKELGLKIGDEIRVDVDPKNKMVSIRPVANLSHDDAKIARLTLNFVKRYRRDLEELAKK